MRRRLVLAAVLLGTALVAAPPPSRADVGEPAILKKVGLDQHPGASLPLDARLVDSAGRPVRLGHFFDGKHPVVLVLGYYTCPMLCSLVIEGATRALAASKSAAASGVRPVFVSIDPRDGPADARAKRRSLAKSVGPRAAAAWSFLTGPKATTSRIAKAIGFRYGFDRRSGQYAHPAVMVAVAPDGRVSRYVVGAQPEQTTFDDALEAAAAGEAGRSIQDAILQCCYRYTPSLRRFAGALTWFLRLGGVLILVAAGAGIAFALRWVRRRAVGPPARPGRDGARPLHPGSDAGPRYPGAGAGPPHRRSDAGARYPGSGAGPPHRPSDAGPRYPASDDGAPRRGASAGARYRGSDRGVPHRGSDAEALGTEGA